MMVCAHADGFRDWEAASGSGIGTRFQVLGHGRGGGLWTLSAPMAYLPVVNVCGYM